MKTFVAAAFATVLAGWSPAGVERMSVTVRGRAEDVPVLLVRDRAALHL